MMNHDSLTTESTIFFFEFYDSIFYQDTAVILIRLITKMSEKPSMRVVFVPKEEPG